ncbi:MAG TPA: ATP-binding cassette domain-containing protein [Bacteroidales bacterium]|nr:ATP-binding cassette domain-containing protein [Bacteroidales bacterium]HNS47165.1 ATP-binding cassette domain-containing protein [Bacteroidales bacterium]
MDIIVENFTKKYGTQKAVDNISFVVKAGEVLGFLGPNGAGKTTTMKAITTFFAPTSGDIRLGNVSVRENPEEIKKHIGYLPENNPLYSDLPVIDYLKFVAGLYLIPKSKVKEKILEMVTLCGLEGEKHKKIGELSKGYKQRVGLAQALIHDPDVLILDEPTAGLDPNQIVEIRELIKKIGKQKTVILSSHILAEVEATCDRILIINRGRIVADGTPATLRQRAQGNEVLKVTIEGGDRNEVFKALREMPSVEMVDLVRDESNGFEIHSQHDHSSRKAVFQLCVRNKWFLTEMTPYQTKLEDVFRELTMN